MTEAEYGESFGYLTIACTLRSGSNFLCDMLGANGFGDPREWFQDAPLSAPDGREAETDLRRFHEQAARFRLGHERSSWRSVKFNWSQLRRLRMLAAGDADAVGLLRGLRGGRWLRLRRRDLAAQAVSLYAAQMTGDWMGMNDPGLTTVPYDPDAILERFTWLATEEFALTEFFRTEGIEHVDLTYEDIACWNEGQWQAFLRSLDPGFAGSHVNYGLARNPVPVHPHIAEMKAAFRGALLAGIAPRTANDLLDGIQALVWRAQRQRAPDGILAKVALDALTSPDGFSLRKLDLRRDLQLSGSTASVEQSHFTDGLALRLDIGAACRFPQGGRRVLIEFYMHGWSGIAQVQIGDLAEDVDLFAERPAARYFIHDLSADFAGPITIRASDRKHLLSEGWEVWVQRIFVLGDSEDLAPAAR